MTKCSMAWMVKLFKCKDKTRGRFRLSGAMYHRSSGNFNVLKQGMRNHFLSTLLRYAILLSMSNRDLIRFIFKGDPYHALNICTIHLRNARRRYAKGRMVNTINS